MAAEEQQILIKILADATQTEAVLSQVESRVTTFAAKMNEALKGIKLGRNEKTVTIGVNVNRTQLDRLILDLEKLQQEVTVPVKVNADDISGSVKRKVGGLKDIISNLFSGFGKKTQTTDPFDEMFNEMNTKAKETRHNLDEVSETPVRTPKWDPTYIENLSAKISQAELDLQQYGTALENLGRDATFKQHKAAVDKATGAYDKLVRLMEQYAAQNVGSNQNPAVMSALDTQRTKVTALRDQLAGYQKVLSQEEDTGKNTASTRMHIVSVTERLAREQERLNKMMGQQPTAKDTPPKEDSKGKEKEEEDEEDLFGDRQKKKIEERNKKEAESNNKETQKSASLSAALMQKVGISSNPWVAAVRAVLGILKAIIKVLTTIIKLFVQMYAGLAKISAVLVGGVIKGFAQAVAVVGKLALSVGKVFTNVFAAPFKLAGKMVTSLWNTVSKIWKQFTNAVTRRLFRKLVQELFSAIEEGFESLTQQSTTSATNLGQLKGAFKGIGAAVASSFSPVIAAATSTLMNFAQAVVTALNAVSKFFGTLFGVKYSVVSLTGAVDSLEDSTSGAGSAAKGALADFDELNVLTQSSSGGSSSDSSSTGYTVEEVEGGIGSRLAELFKSGEFEEAGKYVSQWASGLLDNIIAGISNWDSAAFGTHVAEFFNGLTMDSTMFYKFGQSVSLALGKVFGGLNAFLEENDGGQAGVAIAAFLNGLTIESNLTELAGTIKGIIKETCEIATGMLTGDDKVAIGSKLGTFFNELFTNASVWGDVGTSIHDMIVWALGEANTLITSVDFDSIAASVQAFIEGLKLGDCTELVTTVKTAITGAVKLAGSLLTYDNVSTVADAIANLFNNLFDNTDGTFAQLGTNIATTLNNTIKGVNSGIKNTNFADIGTSIGTFLTNLTITFDAESFGETLFNLIDGAIDLLVGNEDSPDGGILNSTAFTGLGTKISTILDELDLPALGGRLGSVASELITTAVGAAVASLNGSEEGKSKGKGIADGILEFIDNIKLSDSTLAGLETLGGNCKQLILDVLRLLFGAADATNGNQDGLKAGIAAFLNGFSFTADEVSTFKDSLKDLFVEVFTLAWDAAKEALGSVTEEVAKKFAEFAFPSIGAANNVYEYIMGLFSGDEEEETDEGVTVTIPIDDVEFDTSGLNTEDLLTKYGQAISQYIGDGSVLSSEKKIFTATIKAGLDKGQTWDTAVENALNFTQYLRDNPNTTYDAWIDVKAEAEDEGTEAVLDIIESGGTSGAGGRICGYPARLNLGTQWLIAKEHNEFEEFYALFKKTTSNTELKLGLKKGSSWDTKVAAVIDAYSNVATEVADRVEKTLGIGVDPSSASASTLTEIYNAVSGFSKVKDSLLTKTIKTTLKGVTSQSVFQTIFDLFNSGDTTKNLSINASPTDITTTIGNIKTTLSAISSIKASGLKKTVSVTMSGVKESSLGNLANVLQATESVVEKVVTVTTNSDEAAPKVKEATTAITGFGKLASKTTRTANVMLSGTSSSTITAVANAFENIKSKTAELGVNITGNSTVEEIAEELKKFASLNGKKISATADIGISGGKTAKEALGLNGLSASVTVSASNLTAFKTTVQNAINGMKWKAQVDAQGGVQLRTAATGGLFGAGSLILAGEAGPEVVANLGGGTSGIMNVRQMAEAVSNGVANANANQNALLRDLITIGKALLGKELIISPSAELGQVMARSSVLYGKI